MGLDIQPRITDDLDLIMDIWRRATVVGHHFLTPPDLDRDEALIRGELIDKTKTWVARDGGEPAGFISLVDTLIVALFVEPALHRRGIGSALVRHVNELYGPLSVEVMEENRSGIAFYGHLGFTLQSKKANSHYPDHTLFIMAQPDAPASGP